MKQKKRERQESDQQKRHNIEESRRALPLVQLRPLPTPDEYAWNCPAHAGGFTYSTKINEMWGHPPDVVFCAVCYRYYRFEIPSAQETSILE